MKAQILNTLRAQAQANLDIAKLNVNLYLNSTTGIGEHPEIVQAIQSQLDVMAIEQGRLDAIELIKAESLEGVFHAPA